MQKPVFSIAILAFLASSAAADVTIEEQTQMGGMMQMMGMGKPTKSSTRVSGDFLRTDDEDQATIFDLAGERIVTLNLKKKTYTVTTFAEMKQKMEQAMAKLQGKQQEKPKEGSDVSMKTDVRVTDTGRTETIQGASCKQYLLEMNMSAQSAKEQQSGTMSTLTEMWMAKDVPGIAEVGAFYRKMGEKAGGAGVNQQWAAAAVQGPAQSLGADIQKMSEEMKKMEGHAMRTVLYMGSVEAAKKEALGETPPRARGRRAASPRC